MYRRVCSVFGELNIRFMEDSDEMRAFIERRLQSLGLDQAEVSRKLGRQRSYLNDYFRKKSPRFMPIDVKLRLAKEIRVQPTALGVPAVVALEHVEGGMMEDAAPYVGGLNEPVPPPHIAQFQMRSRALDQHPRRIVPGQVLGMNLNEVDPSQIESGQIVVAQLLDRYEGTKSYGTVIRQFIAPNKLITNSSTVNEIIALDDPASHIVAVIKGTLAYVIDTRKPGGRTN